MGAGQAVEPAVYNYDRPESHGYRFWSSAAAIAPDLVERGQRAADDRPGQRYDDRSDLARASARLDGYRLAPNTADDLARLPVGRRGSPMDVPRGTNSPATIGGRQYGDHALDEMMSEGFTPSVVDDAIRFGRATTGASGRVGYYSSANNVTVIVENGRVVTVSSGYLKPR